MRHILVRTVSTVMFLLAWLPGFGMLGQAAEAPPVTLFWQEGCPHCRNAKATLKALADDRGGFDITQVEIGSDPVGAALYIKMVTLFELDRAAVPLIVIGDRYVVGHAGGGLARQQYEALLDRCQGTPCLDAVGQIRLLTNAIAGRVRMDPVVPHAVQSDETDDAGAQLSGPGLPQSLSLPIVGEITLAGASLPVLTIVLAGIDGFNPCAMWVLVLLIGLLAGVTDARRMWTLGLVFLLATGVMYFAVMAAWLNVVLWIGAVLWIRLTVGAVAVGAGLFYLRDYWTNPEGACTVTSPGGRKRIVDAFRQVVERPSLLVATIGVAGLAIVVNLIELVCSAGVPAVFTQILAMRDLTMPAYYGYLLLYLLIFLLDDAVIFATAMVTLRSGLISGRYTRITHALGGGLLLALGAVMLLRPDWLG